MYELMVESSFASAHQLRGYKGKCENLHGHNWKVHVHVTAEKLNDIEIAVDFNDLKEMTDEVVGQLDHTVLNEVFPFTERNPSSENVAKWIYDTLKKKINDGNLALMSVTVWESETVACTYYED